MPALHIFNPDNDLALAANLDHYTPPRAAARLRAAGALLPLWYANGGDSVVCYGVNADWLERKVSEFGLNVSLHDHQPNDLAPAPWGWSRAARNDLRREGCAADRLPSDAQLDSMRQLSHRRTAARVSRRVAELLPSLRLVPPAAEVTSRAQAEQIMTNWPDAYIKAPWSSSGRGVIRSHPHTGNALRLCENFISSQGSAMVEQALAPAMDFAMIFECRAGDVHFIGTSVFDTDKQGHYVANILAPEPERFAAVAAVCSESALIDIRGAVAKAIREIIAPEYCGILGVDMLASDNGIIHPCVEINLRKTMGYVACVFADRYLHPGSKGKLTTMPVSSVNGIPPEAYTAGGGHLREGTMWLSPPTEHFAVMAEVAYLK